MSNKSIIELEHVSKEFIIRTGSATTLKEMALRGFFHRGEESRFSALSDICWNLEAGKSYAIVGNNGSGKSTLLKLITGVMKPTSGRVAVHGKVAALLELGAGFHYDLTGMENLFLQGSILGLTREEIIERIDPVLEFSGLSRFIHTPLKRYSSGMIVRLGFALAVTSHADVFIIDEVLAVGDSAFRTKCLQKLNELRDEGKTIVLVSHILDHIEMIAQEVLWLENGQEKRIGPPWEILTDYMATFIHQSGPGDEPQQMEMDEVVERNMDQHIIAMTVSPTGVRMKPRKARISSFKTLNRHGEPVRIIPRDEPVTIEVEIDAEEEIPNLDLTIGYAGFEDLAAGFHGTDQQGFSLDGMKGRFTLVGEMKPFPFMPGRFKISVGLGNSEKKYDFYDLHMEVYSLQVSSTNPRDHDPENNGVMLPPGRFLDH